MLGRLHKPSSFTSSECSGRIKGISIQSDRALLDLLVVRHRLGVVHVRAHKGRAKHELHGRFQVGLVANQRQRCVHVVLPHL